MHKEHLIVEQQELDRIWRKMCRTTTGLVRCEPEVGSNHGVLAELVRMARAALAQLTTREHTSATALPWGGTGRITREITRTSVVCMHLCVTMQEGRRLTCSSSPPRRHHGRPQRLCVSPKSLGRCVASCVLAHTQVHPQAACGALQPASG
jgi:hypothetical protein